MNIQVSRHPGVETALTREDVVPGAPFVTYIPNKGLLFRGLFTETPTYDDELRWYTNAQVGEAVLRVCLYDMGITPDGAGEWANVITISEDQQ